MREIIWFCLVCWCIGGVLVLSAVFNWNMASLPYLSSFYWGRIVCRIFTCVFGLVVIGVGIMVYLASC